MHVTSADVIDAAWQAGIRLFDTADAYDHDNEALVAGALAGRTAEIVTKGGLLRPGGAWRPDGRAKHLAAAARASRERIGAIALYLLHAPDPSTPLATSVRALAKLRDEGVVGAIGLSNVNLHQLEQALAITKIDAIEIELSPWRVDALRSGLVAACEARGMRVLAYRPLGAAAGVRRLERDPIVAELAREAGVTCAELALAWLCSLSPVIVPIPGATRVETARSAARAAAIRLDDRVRGKLSAHFLGDDTRTDGAGEVVLIVGMPAAGKSTLAREYVARGYTRLNRDDRGGSLRELARELGRVLAGGATRVVLDNTYGTRASRAEVIAAARCHGASVRCVVVATSLEAAQHNAVARMLAEHGRLLEPDELGKLGAIGPSAQFRYRRAYEPPRADEGFASIEEFTPPQLASTGRPALILELDDLVWRGRPASPEQIGLLPGARDQLQHTDAFLAGTTWQPLAPPAIAALEARLAQLIDRPISIACCPHPAGPPVCWCRKPLPGLALLLARAHGLDLARSLHVGRGAADRGFAARAGMHYSDGWPTDMYRSAILR